MTPIEVARERVIAAAISLVGSRLVIEANGPSANDDATLELYSDVLDETLMDWNEAVMVTTGQVEVG